MKKILTILLVCIFVVLPTAFADSTTNVTSDGFVWTTDGEAVTIVSYQGQGGAVSVPAEIDGKPVTTIAQYAFSGMDHANNPNKANNSLDKCLAITSIDIPDSVTYIGMRAFRGNTGLVTAKIPGGAFSGAETEYVSGKVGDIFTGCTNLTTVTISEGMVHLPYNFFSGCSKLNNVVLPSTTKTIQANAFNNCSELVNIKLNEGLEYIAKSFAGTNKLTKIILPSTLKQLGTGVAAEAPFGRNMATIYGYPETLYASTYADTYTNVNDNFKFIAISGTVSDASNLNYTVNADGTATITSYKGNGNEDLVIPSMISDGNNVYIVSEIARAAFWAHTSNEAVYPTIKTDATVLEKLHSIKSVYVPDTVSKIGFRAFRDMKIETARVPGTAEFVTESGNSQVFNACASLKSIEITEGIKTIPQSFATNCTLLENVILPEGLETIESKAFTGCTSLKTINLPSTITEIYFVSATDQAFARSITEIKGYIGGGYNYYKACKDSGDSKYDNLKWTSLDTKLVISGEVAPGATLSATGTFVNYEDSVEYPVMCVIAVFKDNGKELVYCGFDQEDTERGMSKDVTATVTIPSNVSATDLEGYTVNAFLWRFDNLAPLVDNLSQ